MTRARAFTSFSALLCLATSCAPFHRAADLTYDADTRVKLAASINADPDLPIVLDRARALLKTGFTAGSHYQEVWIRDLATFMELACEVADRKKIKDALLTFFVFQGQDGNIIDGYVPGPPAPGMEYKYITTPAAPNLLGHKNTVETDQEASLIQGVYKYVQSTGDDSFLAETVQGRTILDRMESALQFLLDHRFSKKYGLIWGATTADWGDVQPEHDWGVALDENSHLALDIYDNAMFVIAINNFIELIQADHTRADHWRAIGKRVANNVRRHLWDKKRNKFIPHIYLDGSPFPADFDENSIHYHGGTAVAIEAGFLSREEIRLSLAAMIENVRLAGAQSIGLTIYPAYPAGFFKNPGMGPYSYQNGGDWTWFGGRMIRQLIEHGFIEEAHRELRPMLRRVVENGDFHEWYALDGSPKGAHNYRGAAGVLGKSIELLLAWAEEHN